jgi:capsular exopolysaccharide synthesis family protein
MNAADSGCRCGGAWAVPAILPVGWLVANTNVDDMTEHAAPQPLTPGPTPSHYTPAGDVSILDRLGVLYRYRFIAATVFVLTTLTIMLQGYTPVQVNMIEPGGRANAAVSDTLLQQEKVPPVSSNGRADSADVAKPPESPRPPSGRRTWLMSVVIGLALAVGVAFGLDYMNDTIKTPEDISQRFKQPFLGLVPSVRGDKHPLLASSQVPKDFGESFRSLRTSLVATYRDAGPKVLMVTSAQPLEGKTITAANIAMAMAYGGARVLLIDADMRHPGLHRLLRLTNDRGLSQVLNGQARVRDVVQRTVDPNLLAITAGTTPPNPSELLSSARMKTLLDNLADGSYDWILIDAPSVLAVTDALILAPSVSGVVYVIGAEMTRPRLVQRALDTILLANPRSVSIVLNKVDFSRNRSYYSRHFGQQYKDSFAGAST